MTAPTPAVRLIRIGDVLTLAGSLNEAVHMALGYLEDETAKDALRVINDTLAAKINEAKGMVQEAREALK